MSDSLYRQDEDSGVILEEKKEVRLKKPKMYQVIMLNDDYTTMEFVVWVMKAVFHKPEAEAQQLMMAIHTKGKALCGLYTFDVAQTKALQVKTHAENNGHPLKCVVEPNS